MKNRNDLLLSIEDYNRIVESIAIHSTEHSADLLLNELDRAKLVRGQEVPAGVVRMNSTLIFKDLDSAEETEVMIVYPEQANIQERKISVLAPMGSALIGLSEGQSIEWQLPNGKIRRIRVLQVLEESAHPPPSLQMQGS